MKELLVGRNESESSEWLSPPKRGKQNTTHAVFVGGGGFKDEPKVHPKRQKELRITGKRGVQENEVG